MLTVRVVSASGLRGLKKKTTTKTQDVSDLPGGLHFGLVCVLFHLFFLVIFFFVPSFSLVCLCSRAQQRKMRTVCQVQCR